MKIHLWLLALVLLIAPSLLAQSKIIIPAGTPEDQALQAVSNENDAQKRTAMLQDFVQKFASNPAAVAYGNWQLSQLYLAAGDSAKALAYGDKALAAMPDVVEILQSQVDVAQQMKSYEKVVEYAARGVSVINSVEKQPKPENLTAEDWKSHLAGEKSALQPSYDYLEVAAYNAIASQKDARHRLAMVERFTNAFPGSRFGEQTAALGILSLQQMQDWSRLAAFADKAAAANPDNVVVLAVVAAALADDPKGANLAKAAGYARKAIELAKAESDDPQVRKTAGVARSSLGYVLLRQEKYAAAVPELRSAVTALKASPEDLQAALFRLGWAYAKMERVADATQALTQASNIQGPYQVMARDMLEKIKAARARPR